ncbi:MAG: protein O-mannosyl-transferase family [Anaerolineae bacterium]
MPNSTERFQYPFTATTLIARTLVPVLLFTLGLGLFIWAGREYYFWVRPWAVLPEALLGVLCWWAALYFFTLLPEIEADEEGVRVHRWGLSWRRIPWKALADVQQTASIDLLGWKESLYAVYSWQTVAGRWGGRARRSWHRRAVPAFRFSGHIRHRARLLGLIQQHLAPQTSEEPLSLDPRWRTVARRIPWMHLLLFAAVLIIYLSTLAPSVLGGDPGEYQFVPYILSMAHPTGTPLYILLSKLWSMWPVGPSVAWRMNLLSAVSASLAVVVVYQHVRWKTRQVVPALVAALILAFGSTFWEQATMADKYAFNALMVALVLHLALRWGQTRSPGTLSLLALTYGLSLAHHRTMVLFALPLLGYVAWYERSALWRNGRRLLKLVVLLCIPLLFYLYLPWAEARNLPPAMWHPRTLGDWFVALYDEGWIREVRVVPIEQPATLSFYVEVLGRDFTWAGVMLGIAGLGALLVQHRPEAIFLGVSYLLQAILAANYHVPRHWVFFLPSFVIVALWIGEGAGRLRAGLKTLDRLGKRARFVLSGVFTIALLTIPCIAFSQQYPIFRESHLGAGVLDPWRQVLKDGYAAERLGQAIVDVAPQAIIVCDWEQSTPLWYYQQVEGWRPDVEIVYPMERLEEMATTGRPLYLARTHPGLADRWHPTNCGPLIALQPEPAFDLPPDITPLQIQLGDLFELAGFDSAQTVFYPSTVVPLTLYWRALRPPPDDYSVSLRLVDSAGQVVAQVDSQHPVLGTYPTSRWAAGEIVADYYEVQLPGDLSPGTYWWGVILYRMAPEGGWENLQVKGSEIEMAIGGSFEVRRRPKMFLSD